MAKTLALTSVPKATTTESNKKPRKRFDVEKRIQRIEERLWMLENNILDKAVKNVAQRLSKGGTR